MSDNWQIKPPRGRIRWVNKCKPLTVRFCDTIGPNPPDRAVELTSEITWGKNSCTLHGVSVETDPQGYANLDLSYNKAGICRIEVKYNDSVSSEFTIFVLPNVWIVGVWIVNALSWLALRLLSLRIFVITVISLLLVFAIFVLYNYWPIGSLYIPSYLPEGTTGTITYTNGKSKSWRSSDKNQLLKFNRANEPRQLDIHEVPNYCGPFSYPFDDSGQRFYIAYVKRAKNVSPTKEIIVKKGEHELFRAQQAADYPYILLLLVEEDNKEQTIEITYTDIYGRTQTLPVAVNKNNPIEDEEW